MQYLSVEQLCVLVLLLYLQVLTSISVLKHLQSATQAVQHTDDTTAANMTAITTATGGANANITDILLLILMIKSWII